MTNYLRYSIKFVIIFSLPAILHFSNLSAQCPDGKILMARLSESSSLSPREQVKEFLPSLDSANKCPSLHDTIRCYLLKKIGGQYYYDEDYVNGLKYYREFLSIATNGGKPKIQINVIVGGYYYLSLILQALNRPNEAWSAFDSCIAVADRYSYVDASNLRAIYTKMEHYFDVGDYYNCINYGTKCQILADGYAKVTSGTENERANTFLSSSLLWEIKAMLELKKYEAAEEILKDKFDESKKMGNKRYYGTIFGQLAELEEHRGNYDKALVYFSKSIISHKESGDYFNCKQSAKDIASKIYFNHYRDVNAALYSYKKALRFKNKDKSKILADKYESLDIYAGIGNLYVYKGIFDSAHYYFQLAFDQLNRGMNENHILRNSQEEIRSFKKIHYVTSLVIDKADAYRKEYMHSNQPELLEKAIQVYKSADLLLDRVKMEQSELDSKLFWRSDSRRLYENAIDACFRSGNTKDAFYFFEKSRAVLLNDQLINQHWLNKDDISMQTSINKKIIRLENELKNLDSQTEAYRNLQQQLLESNQELEHFDLLIRKNNPLYYQSFLDTLTINIADIRKNVLNNHEALVEIFTGDSAVYSMIITPTQIHISKIDKKDFNRLTNSYIQYISNEPFLNQHFDDFIKISHQLYQLIFNEYVLPKGRIIISPQGRYFPFEALVINELPGKPNYFLNDYAVSYTYSARYLINGFETDGPTDAKDFIGMAPVQYRPVFPMAALLGSDNSLNRIAALFGETNSMVGREASRNNFLQKFPGYKIVQLYTHASDSSDNNEPVIYFADSSLYLSELMPDTKPMTQLVVLSACETGNGIEYKGEGVFSFNRGFAAIGIPSSVMNLWSVDNESTYKLNEIFYKYLTEGLPLDVAMQKAKKDFIQNGSRKNALPYYWAAPVLAGKSDAVDYKEPFSWSYIMFPILIAALTYFAWAFARRKKMSKISYNILNIAEKKIEY